MRSTVIRFETVEEKKRAQAYAESIGKSFNEFVIDLIKFAISNPEKDPIKVLQAEMEDIILWKLKMEDGQKKKRTTRA